METKKAHYLIGLARIVLGWIFLWAFLDKMFGLGFATTSDKSWLAGESPTYGFLKFATHGPFADIYQAIAGHIVVDTLYMAGLLAVGTALILGIGVRIASWSGALMMALFYLAAIPPSHNPLVDEHIIYIFLLLIFCATRAGQWLGLGKWWSETALVKRFPFLE